MTTIIPSQKDKKFVVDNLSMTRGNIYSTFNIMFDADIGRIKLNPPLSKLYDETTNAAFVNPFSIVIASADSSLGTILDAYVLTTGFVWGTLGGLVKITVANAPANALDATADMCLFLGVNTTERLLISDSDGLHSCAPTAGRTTWLLDTTTAFKNNYIIFPFLAQNRLYMVKSTKDAIYSASEASVGSYSPQTSGSFTLVVGLSNITCARAASKTIWFASSGNNNSTTTSNRSKVYEWDGVSTNPTNIYVLDTDFIQSITILNDIPYVIDGRGRLWAFNGYTFTVVANIPVRNDDYIINPVIVHRNGMITDSGKIYVLISSNGDGTGTKNTTERCLAGVWCYDPAIGFYHFSSPDNMSVLTIAVALARYSTPLSFICGYVGLTTSITSPKNRLAITDTTKGITGGAMTRTGYIITQFIESKFLQDAFNTIAVKYRQMIDSAATIEVKYRNYKNIECNGTITWTSTTTFTISTAVLAGTSTYFNTPVAVGDEVMVQQGSGTGFIGQITSLVDNSGTTTVTVDRVSTVSSGTGYATFNNYATLYTITSTNPDKTFKNLRASSAGGTMLQIKLVLSWKGYYDEVQEIQVPELVQVPTS